MRQQCLATLTSCHRLLICSGVRNNILSMLTIALSFVGDGKVLPKAAVSGALLCSHLHAS